MTPQGFGQQRPWHRRVCQRSRMELEELEIGHRCPRAQRHRNPVAGGDRRVRRHREQLAGPAGRQDHVSSTHHQRTAGLVGHLDADAAPAVEDEVVRERPLVDHHRAAAYRGDQRPLDLGPGGGSARVDDARDGMTTLPGQFEFPGVVVIEPRADGDEVVDPGGALVDQYPHRVDVAESGTGRERVREVQVEVVVIPRQRGGDPTLGPPCGRQLQIGFGHDADAQPQLVRGTYGGGEAGDPTADDHDVELVGHAGSPVGPPVPAARVGTPTLSISRARPNCTAPNNLARSSQRCSGSSESGSATST